LAQPTPEYRLNIRARLLLLCLGVAVPFLAIGSFSFWQQYKTLHAQAQRATEYEARLAARSLSEWLKVQRDALRATTAIVAIQKPEAMGRVMFCHLHAQQPWRELFLVEPSSGKLLDYCATEPVKAKAFLKFSDHKFYLEVIAKRKAQVSGYIASPLTGKPSLLLATPVVQSGQIKALLVAAIEPKSLLQLLSDPQKDNATIVTIIDANQRVIVRTQDNALWEGKNLSQTITANPQESEPDKLFQAVGIADGQPRTYTLEQIPELGWLLVAALPAQLVFGSAQSWLSIMVLLSVAAIAIAVLLTYLVTLHFTDNIDVLVKEAQAIGKGDFSRRVYVKTGDELGSLAQAFNQMASQLQINQEQKFLVEKLADAIRQSLDLEQILDTTVRELGRALSASRCCLALIDNFNDGSRAANELVFDHIWSDSSLAGNELTHRSVVIQEKSVIEMIIQQGSILALDLLDEDGPSPLFGNGKDSPDDWKSIRSLIACPITADNLPLGMILVHQCDRHRTWSDSELDLVETTARHVTLAMQHAQLYRRTKTMAEQEMLINHIVRSVRSSLDVDTILTTATEELAKALGASRCQIAQPRVEGPLVITQEFHTDDLPSSQSISLYSQPLDFNPETTNQAARGLVLGIDLKKVAETWVSMPESSEPSAHEPKTVREAPIAVINNTSLDSRTMPFRHFIEQVGSKSLIAAPLLSETQLVGLLIVHQCDRIRTWRKSEIQLVQAIADQLAIAVTHAHLFAQVRYQAITDGLTGLYNHVYFKHRLNEELRLADRKGMPCSLLMIDLDKLKQINDNFGHPVGDAAIRHVANKLKTTLRSGDTAARYGGEEFIVILPETSLLEAALIGDRLCGQIGTPSIAGLGRVTISVGAASYPHQAKNAEELVSNADKALYCAKSAGRNQIWIFEEPGKPVAEFRVPQRLSAAKNRNTKEGS
jgi:diguanylate cyclase (GGDEF)-like protein